MLGDEDLQSDNGVWQDMGSQLGLAKLWQALLISFVKLLAIPSNCVL